MSKKKALGADPLGWIKPTVSANEEPKETEKEKAPRKNRISQSSIHMPKFQTYEAKLTLRLKEDQLEFLSRLEREIMKNRSRPNRNERITKNSIIRAMIDVFKNLNVDTNEIRDEDELLEKLKRSVESQELEATSQKL